MNKRITGGVTEFSRQVWNYRKHATVVSLSEIFCLTYNLCSASLLRAESMDLMFISDR